MLRDFCYSNYIHIATIIEGVITVKGERVLGKGDIDFIMAKLTRSHQNWIMTELDNKRWYFLGVTTVFYLNCAFG